MEKIGLTGGIGTGKTTVAKMLEELGATVIELDSLGHEAIKPGTKAYNDIVRMFGKEIMKPGGEIDRTRLGAVVFNDKDRLRQLNNIVHPAIDSLLNEEIEKAKQKGVKVLVLEAAALLEAGRAHQADEIWITVAPETTVLRRLEKRSGYAEKESRERIRSQITNEQRFRYAAVVIDTDCTMDKLRAKVKKEWEKLQERL